MEENNGSAGAGRRDGSARLGAPPPVPGPGGRPFLRARTAAVPAGAGAGAAPAVSEGSALQLRRVAVHACVRACMRACACVRARVHGRAHPVSGPRVPGRRALQPLAPAPSPHRSPLRAVAASQRLSGRICPATAGAGGAEERLCKGEGTGEGMTASDRRAANLPRRRVRCPATGSAARPGAPPPAAPGSPLPLARRCGSVPPSPPLLFIRLRKAGE